MKLNLKTISILSLVGFFLVSTMFCCCFTKEVEAKQEQPSCHQTQQKSDTSQHDSEECDCDQSKAVIQDGEFFVPSWQGVILFTFDQPVLAVTSDSFERQAYQAPPPQRTTIPLYIQNSILRI
jgi:hypothetical protein